MLTTDQCLPINFDFKKPIIEQKSPKCKVRVKPHVQ